MTSNKIGSADSKCAASVHAVAVFLTILGAAARVRHAVTTQFLTRERPSLGILRGTGAACGTSGPSYMFETSDGNG